MDTRTGQIWSSEDVTELRKRASQGDNEAREILSHLSPMHINPTPAQTERKKVGRNDPCPCGSGKKFKRCCMDRRTP